MVQFPMIGVLAVCKCGRKVLVEQAINGSHHTISTNVCCWDCLTTDQKEKAKELYKILLH